MGAFEYAQYDVKANVGENKTKTFVFTVKAVQEGEGYIVLEGIRNTNRAGFHTVVGNTETLLKDDYDKKYPTFELAENKSTSTERQKLIDENKCLPLGGDSYWCPGLD